MNGLLNILDLKYDFLLQRFEKILNYLTVFFIKWIVEFADGRSHKKQRSKFLKDTVRIIFAISIRCSTTTLIRLFYLIFTCVLLIDIFHGRSLIQLKKQVG